MRDRSLRTSNGGSNTPTGVHLFDLLEARRANLAEWLESNAPECEVAQRHLDEGTEERMYWHFGYLTAIKDVLALLGNTSTPRH